MVILVETRCSEEQAKKAIKNFGLDFYHVEEARDLGFVGSKYTWKGPKWKGLDRVFKYLDRALFNAEWRTRFPDARVDILTRTHSDHHPMMISLEPSILSNGHRPFWYEVMWSLHPNFKGFINQNWRSKEQLSVALDSLTKDLRVWNREIFGHIRRQKVRLMNRIGGIQRAASYERNDFLEKLERQLNRELEEILDREKILWMQKPREDWVVKGDRNTRYFHTKTIIRRRRNRILKLRRLDGSWMEDQKELINAVLIFFKELYNEEDQNPLLLNTGVSYPPLREEISRNMDSISMVAEIRRAIFSIGSLKVPGIDGFPVLFYKKIWNVIQKNVVDHVLRIWNNPCNIKECTQTLISLIPKVHVPESITQFKPIALCNRAQKLRIERGLKWKRKALSLPKTSIIFSNNVKEHLRRAIKDKCNYQEQPSLELKGFFTDWRWPGIWV
ncbi:uncharacterized protein [Arachis hypogaea]|uniref:uncharacterized protein n=1 Tax=Arachis hypogaea TaxID=3818 RepID=UPI003B214BCD